MSRTYEIDLSTCPRSNDFAHAREVMRGLKSRDLAEYDASTKTWTVTIEDGGRAHKSLETVAREGASVTENGSEVTAEELYTRW